MMTEYIILDDEDLKSLKNNAPVMAKYETGKKLIIITKQGYLNLSGSKIEEIKRKAGDRR